VTQTASRASWAWRKSRINRATYWLLVAFGIAAIGLLSYLGRRSSVMEIAVVAIGVPRLHDIGRSGWIAGAVIAAEIAAVVAVVALGGGVQAIQVTAAAIVLVMLLLAIWLGVVPGDPGPNKWGPPPAAGIGFGNPATDYDETFS
jgi:uncharacterized membrane protein YhaH (DUF805 family)